MTHVLQSKRLISLLCVCALLGWIALGTRAVAQHPNLERSVRLLHKPDCVSIGVADFDLVQRRHKTLRGSFALLDAQGGTITRCDVDFHAPTARSCVLVRKPPGTDCASVTVRLADGETVLLDRQLPLPPVSESRQCAATTDEKVQTRRGANAAAAVPPAVAAMRLPDFARAETANLRQADRKIEVERTFRPVRCSLNYPIAGARNNSFIGRQTSEPDNQDNKSLYVSLRSSLFHPQTGAYEMDAKYLAEIPLDKSWLLPVLQAEGDAAAAAPAELLGIHACTHKAKTPFGEIYLTGQDPGGLMQISHSVCQDDQGNLYFAQDGRGCIRLNIRTGQWEGMPVNVYAFLEPYLPAMKNLPYPKDQVTARRIDVSTHVQHHGGRVYLSFARDAIFGTSLYLAAVVSIPTTHWDDPAAFEREMRFIGGSWPTAKPALFDRWVEPNELTRKLMSLVGDGPRLYMVSYHNNYCWTADLAEDGTVKMLKRYDVFDGKRIVGVSFDRHWSDAANQPLGATLSLRLESEQSVTAFLPISATELTATRPRDPALRHPAFPGVVRGEGQYGLTEFDKPWLARYLGWDEKLAKAGTVSIYYDALAVMRRDPQRYRFLLDRIGGASLAPSYHAVSLPDQPNCVLGVGEYGYYQALLDTTGGGDAPVAKEFLKLDTGDVPSDLAVAIGLGPYAHVWHQEGDRLYLYYVGYTGIARMLYSFGGRRLSRFRMEDLSSRLPMTQVDAPSGGFKWYRELNPGLDGKLIATGVHEANRGGSPYCNGLLWFDTAQLNAQHKLSALSCGHSTSQLDWRVVYGAGGPSQEIYIGADYSDAYAYMLPEPQRPVPVPKILVYEDSPSSGVHDSFSFTLGPAGSKSFDHVEHAFAPDQVHLLLLVGDGQSVYLCSLDPAAGRLADVRRLPGRLVTFDRPSTALIKTPDDRTMFCTLDEAPSPSATFTEVVVAPDGELSFRPHSTLTARDAAELRAKESVIAFLPDLVQDDGSCDLLIGATPPSTAGETRVRLIRDFLEPR